MLIHGACRDAAYVAKQIQQRSRTNKQRVRAA
jgi:hypothetical protein